LPARAARLREECADDGLHDADTSRQLHGPAHRLQNGALHRLREGPVSGHRNGALHGQEDGCGLCAVRSVRAETALRRLRGAVRSAGCPSLPATELRSCRVLAGCAATDLDACVGPPGYC